MRIGGSVAIALASCFVLVAGGAVARSMIDPPDTADDYGPAVEVLEQWHADGPRGDLGDDLQVTSAAESAAAHALRQSYPQLSVDGLPPRTAFAVSTPSGAMALVVVFATSTERGESNIAYGVSLPVGVGVWLDSSNAPTYIEVQAPASVCESATCPSLGDLPVGMWQDGTEREMVLFDTGYPTAVSEGILAPREATAEDLVPAKPAEKPDFVDGVARVTLSPDVVSGTSTVSIGESRAGKYSLVLGTAYYRAPSYRALEELSLYIEGGGAQRPVRIRPYPPAYGGYDAQRLGRQWTKTHVSVEPTWQRRVAGSGIVPQAKLPGGRRLLFQWVLEGKAYVAFVKSQKDGVQGVRCYTPGPILTVTCLLPGGEERLVVVDEPFTWRAPGEPWVTGRPSYFDETYAAVMPAEVEVHIVPRRSEAFTLRFDGQSR